MGGTTYTECFSLITDAMGSLCSHRNEGEICSHAAVTQTLAFARQEDSMLPCCLVLQISHHSHDNCLTKVEAAIWVLEFFSGSYYGSKCLDLVSLVKQFYFCVGTSWKPSTGDSRTKSLRAYCCLLTPLSTFAYMQINLHWAHFKTELTALNTDMSFTGTQ